MRWRKRLDSIVPVVLVVASMAAADAAGAPCAGFLDVDFQSPFCPSVEWLRNRGVTTGCAPDLYCPDRVVDRMAMAAFMHRLGTVLTPKPTLAEESPGALDLDTVKIVCTTPDEAIAGYPRLAIVDGSVSALATLARTLRVQVVHSTDAGLTWNATFPMEIRAGGTAGRWFTVPAIGRVELQAGSTVRFGLSLYADELAAGNELDDSRCGVRVLYFNRDGLVPPY